MQCDVGVVLHCRCSVAACFSVLTYNPAYNSPVPSPCVALLAAECCSVWQCAALYRNVLQRVALYRNVLQRVAVCCRVLQCMAVCSRVLQCIAVCCSVPTYIPDINLS